MTQKQAIESWLRGVPLLCVEFRSFKVETPTMRDKETGRAVSRVVARYALEMGGDSVTITEWMADGTDPAKVLCAMKKGDLGVLHVESLIREKGLLTGRGKFEPFTKE